MPDKWQCTACTFQSDGGTKCDVCGAARASQPRHHLLNASQSIAADGIPDDGVDAALVQSVLNDSLTAVQGPPSGPPSVDADGEDHEQLARAIQDSLSGDNDAEFARALAASLGHEAPGAPPSYTQMEAQIIGGAGGSGGAGGASKRERSALSPQATSKGKRRPAAMTAAAAAVVEHHGLDEIATEMLHRFCAAVAGDALKAEIVEILNEAESVGIQGLHNRVRVLRVHCGAAFSDTFALTILDERVAMPLGGHVVGCEPSKPFCIRTASLISTLTRLCFSPTIQFPKASFAHNKTEGRTPLAYAVTKNLDRMTRDLIDIGADVNLLMGGTTTPLTIAALNKHRYVRYNIIIYIHTPEYTHTLCVCVCVCGGSTCACYSFN